MTIFCQFLSADSQNDDRIWFGVFLIYTEKIGKLSKKSRGTDVLKLKFITKNTKLDRQLKQWKSPETYLVLVEMSLLSLLSTQWFSSRLRLLLCAWEGRKRQSKIKNQNFWKIKKILIPYSKTWTKTFSASLLWLRSRCTMYCFDWLTACVGYKRSS